MKTICKPKGIYMKLEDIVMKLIGSVQPYGSEHLDTERLENMKTLTALVEYLLYQIEQAAESANRPEASVRSIGLYAKNFLDKIRRPDYELQ